MGLILDIGGGQVSPATFAALPSRNDVPAHPFMREVENGRINRAATISAKASQATFHGLCTPDED